MPSGYPDGWVLVPFGRRDVATHQRRTFVNRARGCRDISSSKVSWGRVGSGRSYSVLSVIYERTLPRASRSARNKALFFFVLPLYKYDRQNDLQFGSNFQTW